MVEARVDVAQGIAPDLLDRRQELDARISAIQSQLIELSASGKPDREELKRLGGDLASADDEYQALKKEIRRKHPAYADLHYPEPLALDGAQKLLSDESVLLEYVLGNERSFVFAVSSTGYRVARLPAASSLNTQVVSLRTALSRPARSTFSSYLVSARGLYRDLVKPVEDLLKNKRELVIAADGILNYVPFEVLLKESGPQEASQDARRLPYLVRDYALRYVPSAGVLASLVARSGSPPQSTKTFAGIGDPLYGARAPRQPDAPLQMALRSAFEGDATWALAPLSESGREVRRIAELYPSEETALFLEREASEENVTAGGRLSQYRYIHFATHGLLNERKPQFSGLVLTLPESKDAVKEAGGSAGRVPFADGLLQVYEIFNMKLNADLVVLSACETGLGKEVRGEGLVGLTRAFLDAGTPSVVVSLWKVADSSTADLMVRFYSHLKRGDANRADALRRAQLELIEKTTFSHPFYWAPFVLVGN